jgi:hypothetical protein
MRRLALGLLGLVLCAGWPAVVGAQAPKAARPAARPAPDPHASSELDCRLCHQGKHRGVVQMYLGLGGRGTPMIPSHMLQVRVQCVACHTVPKEEESAARIVGQTFRPTEQACVGCHGEAYRGMLQRWVDTLARMRAIVAPKLAAAQAGLAAAKGTPPERVGRLVGDADHNLRFVALAKGVHNVFYAADLLKLSNTWLDEALAALGAPPAKGDDTLVRGAYCGVLCHEQAGVKLPETVVFGGRKIPHARHVSQFGAVCTACHSAEVHRAVTATPATCTGCHHSPTNDRCESCHRVQSAFYRGQVPAAPVAVEPNVMAAAVGCTGCHVLARKHSRAAVGETCVGCHDAAYTSFYGEWTTGLDAAAATARAAVARAEAALGRERRARRPAPAAEALVREARAALAIVAGARAVHNPAAAEALLDAARKKGEEALARVGSR